MKYNYAEDCVFKKPLITFKQIIIVLLACMLIFSVQTGFNNYSIILTQVHYAEYLQKLETKKNTEGFDSLSSINNDILAWITINDVELSVPIVKTSNKEDENFYLTHGFDKNKNSLGCPYQEHSYDLSSNNTLFIGHSSYTMTMFGNKTNESLFGKLNTYTNTRGDFDYLMKLETSNEVSYYKIIGYFYYNITDTTSSQYQEISKNIYGAGSLTNEASYNNYINTLKKYTLSNKNIESTFGDQFVTLFTCYFNLDFRTIVIAKKI